MAQTTVTPFLMFEGNAQEAIRYYVSLFDDGQVLDLNRYGANEAGAEGTLRLGKFSLAGQTIMAIDSPVNHGFTFTPAMSLFVECTDAAQIQILSTALSDGGGVLMPLGDYGFSRAFAWVSDRYGVSWQLNLP